MSSVEEAWSIEYGDFIDPETAYDLFWSGVIQDKQRFICPFCYADMTCVNLDVEEQNWVINPHYRGRPRHKEGCEENRTKASNFKRDEKQNNDTSTGKTDVLCLERPKGFFSTRNKTLQPHTSSVRLPQKKKRSATQNRYSIRPLVSKFITYRTQGTLADNFVSIKDETLSYEALFTGVYHQEQFMTERPVIYWGTVRILWIEKTQSYFLKFCNPFIHNEEKIYPSFFISKSLLDNYPVKRLLEKRLNKAVASSKDHRAFAFIYGVPIEKINSKTNCVHLNFELGNLDLLEIRSLSLFDHLKRKKAS